MAGRGLNNKLTVNHLFTILLYKSIGKYGGFSNCKPMLMEVVKQVLY